MDNDKTFKIDLISKKSKEFNLTAYAIGKATGISIPTIQSIIDKKATNPNNSTLNALLEYLENVIVGTNHIEGTPIPTLKEPSNKYEISDRTELVETQRDLISTQKELINTQRDLIQAQKEQVEDKKNYIKSLENELNDMKSSKPKNARHP